MQRNLQHFGGMRGTRWIWMTVCEYCGGSLNLYRKINRTEGRLEVGDASHSSIESILSSIFSVTTAGRKATEEV